MLRKSQSNLFKPTLGLAQSVRINNSAPIAIRVAKTIDSMIPPLADAIFFP